MTSPTLYHYVVSILVKTNDESFKGFLRFLDRIRGATNTDDEKAHYKPLKALKTEILTNWLEPERSTRALKYLNDTKNSA